jgi:hypothetical protein
VLVATALSFPSLSTGAVIAYVLAVPERKTSDCS